MDTLVFKGEVASKIYNHLSYNVLSQPSSLLDANLWLQLSFEV